MNIYCAILVFIAILHSGTCLRCYECDSSKGDACGDEFIPNSGLVQSCGKSKDGQEKPGEFFSMSEVTAECVKVVGLDKSGRSVIRRTCSFETSCGLEKIIARGSMQHCSTCTGDLCNHAASFNIAAPLICMCVFLLRHLIN